MLQRLRARLEALVQAETGPAAKAGLLGVTAVMTIAAATLRLSTEAHLAVSLALLLPMLLVAWYLGIGWGLAAAGFVVLSWLTADLIAVTDTVPYWVVVTNAIVRLGVFCLVAGLAASLRHVYRHLALLATRDSLTGLANRRHFMSIAESERRRAIRYHHPLTLAFFDLDGFKRLNDAEGHRRGDDALRLFGRYLRERLRSIDSAARMGGDEFVVLLPETGTQTGPQVIAELQTGVGAVLGAHGLSLRASAGVVTFLGVPGSVDEMLQAADRLMYEAKAQGSGELRFAVQVAALSPPPQRKSADASTD